MVRKINKILVTVIIPVYNTEKYIEKCLISVLNQTYTNIEVIVVNDGSTDNSLKIVKSFKSNDKRIKIINQKNMGCSSARNAGLNYSHGDYITFIDSDDYVHPEYISYLLNLCQKEKTLVGQVDYKYVNDSTSEEHLGKKCKIKKMDFNKLFTSKKRLYRVISCGKIYSKELFKDIRFTEGVINEDEETTFFLLYKANKIVLSNCILYYYRMSENSIMRKKRNSVNYDFVINHNKIINFLINNNEKDLLCFERKELCLRLIRCYINAKKNNISQTELNKMKNMYNDNFKKITNYCNFSILELMVLVVFEYFPNFISYVDCKINIIKRLKLLRMKLNRY